MQEGGAIKPEVPAHRLFHSDAASIVSKIMNKCLKRKQNDSDDSMKCKTMKVSISAHLRSFNFINTDEAIID